MADQEFCGGGPNWWDSSSTSASRSRFDGGSGGGSSPSSTTTTLANGGGACGYGWLTDSHMAADINNAAVAATAARSCTDSKIDASALQLVGLGLSSHHAVDWNHHHQQPPLLRNTEKAENSFRAMLQEGMGVGVGLNPPNFHHETTGLFSSHLQWRPNEDSPSSEMKQIGGGLNFSLDNKQPQFSPGCSSSMESSITCQGLTSPSSTIYGGPCPSSNILQGFMGSQPQNQPQMNYQQNYLGLENQQLPQFLRSSSSTHFTNTSPYLNANVSPNLLGPQLPMPVFEEKPTKHATEVKDTSSTAGKKGVAENSNTKRGRSETATSALPPFKVRKEKMGDRITALQQLVSPFGKTDTASVLSEAIEYIKFLHEQVSVLSTPYLKGGAPYQQGGDKAKAEPDKLGQDLRSRGLCLAPVSSTFPMTHETTVDFWTPTFGGTFR